MKILLGNAFPLSLIRHNVSISPQSVDTLKSAIEHGELYSFWGHFNTIPAANLIIGCDVTPRIERPAIELDRLGYPVFDGLTFDTCWILSPDYITGFRPEIGEEVSVEKIVDWHVLKMAWSV